MVLDKLYIHVQIQTLIRILYYIKLLTQNLKWNLQLYNL